MKIRPLYNMISFVIRLLDMNFRPHVTMRIIRTDIVSPRQLLGVSGGAQVSHIVSEERGREGEREEGVADKR